MIEFNGQDSPAFDEVMEVLKRYPDFEYVQINGDSILSVPGLEIYPSRRKIYRGHKEISLTAKEYDLFYLLVVNRGQVLTYGQIDSFESLAKFTADTEQKYEQLDSVHLSNGQKLSRLKELSKVYTLYEPYCATYKESQSLKGLAKVKFDREHKESLAKYPEMRERLQNLVRKNEPSVHLGEKITPKQWKAEIQSLQAEYDSIGKEKSKTATELAYAEVISYNEKNLERELQNESRQHNRQQSRTKRREEEI